MTNVSGRGVGMDVVRTNIEKIGGSVDLTSTLGHGTVMRVTIPLTLAIIPALIVRQGEERYAIPQANLLELVRMNPDDPTKGVEYVAGVPVHRLRGRLLPLLDLGAQLGSGSEKRAAATIAVLRSDSTEFGLVVDEVLETQEIVVKPLGAALGSLSLFAGAAVMGDGRIALILDVLGLAGAGRVQHASASISSLLPGRGLAAGRDLRPAQPARRPHRRRPPGRRPARARRPPGGGARHRPGAGRLHHGRAVPRRPAAGGRGRRRLGRLVRRCPPRAVRPGSSRPACPPR